MPQSPRWRDRRDWRSAPLALFAALVGTFSAGQPADLLTLEEHQWLESLPELAFDSIAKPMRLADLAFRLREILDRDHSQTRTALGGHAASNL